MIGGTAPTLVVAVRAEDLASGRGYAQADGSDQPLSLAIARHTACDGAIQRVTSDPDGRIVAIGTLDRVFNHHQRKAITLRDGGCLIPGCHVPAGWCEIHHVHDHARGGPPHRKRRPALLAPPPHPRQQRLADPHAPRDPPSPRPELVGPTPKMATHHQIPHPYDRTPQPTTMRAVGAANLGGRCPGAGASADDAQARAVSADDAQARAVWGKMPTGAGNLGGRCTGAGSRGGRLPQGRAVSADDALWGGKAPGAMPTGWAASRGAQSGRRPVWGGAQSGEAPRAHSDVPRRRARAQGSL